MADRAHLSDLYDYVIQETKGACMEGQMLHALRQSSREFCDDTEAWKETLDPHNLVADQKAYTLEWDWCARVQRIYEVRWNTDAGVTAGNKGAVQSLDNYAFDLPDTLSFIVPPSTSVVNGLEADVIYVPTLQTCELPEWFLNRWAEALYSHAIQYLLSIPGTKWYNPVRAQMWQNKYDKYYQRAVSEKEKLNKSGDISFSA